MKPPSLFLYLDTMVPMPSLCQSSSNRAPSRLLSSKCTRRTPPASTRERTSAPQESQSWSSLGPARAQAYMEALVGQAESEGE